jgi:hypothetical protein
MSTPAFASFDTLPWKDRVDKYQASIKENLDSGNYEYIGALASHFASPGRSLKVPSSAFRLLPFSCPIYAPDIHTEAHHHITV